ncbi:LOW QUALITY PROTEIN: probable integral membrane protein [Psychrobacter sp. JCM 18903]|nr:LOW QUALITY PROTEIN: probable integral membrane protein [Psychrobacter sp. JCM 18903]
MNNNNKKENYEHNKPAGLFADKTYEATSNTANSTLKSAVTQSVETQDNQPLSTEPLTTTTSMTRKTIASGEPLKLAVVGHTNTGKTSILRTLLRDVYFGEVKNEAATTRHVEQAKLTDSQTGEVLVVLYDTPGLEDASGLMDWLEDNTASRRDGIERLQQFLAADIAQGGEALNSNEDYSQEAKVIRQLLASDMAIYVVDAREPVLGKYKDELAILSWAAIPVMPVFNFTDSQDANIDEWQTMLARRNLHISTRFDSVAFEFADEMRLWQNLATMLTHSEMLEQLMQRRIENWAQLNDEANIIIADFLINVAAFVREISEDDDPMPVLQQMQEAVRQSERAMQHNLLNLYKFYDNDVAATPLELKAYQQDPFDPELLKSYGIRTTSGAAAGALLGLGIDAAALGTTLGLGAAIGGIAGGLLSNTSSIADRITGVKRLYIDPATLTLLATRSIDLLTALRHRGHAATDATQLLYKGEKSSIEQSLDDESATVTPWPTHKLPSELKKARGKPQWSSLSSGKSEQAQLLRADMAWSLSVKLQYKRE